MKDYDDKVKQIAWAQRDIAAELDGLHPIDKAEAYHEVSRITAREADRLQKQNAEFGVPEKAEDQK